MTSSCFGIILAAGSGSRFGSTTPKQYHLLAGRTVLEHTIDTLLALPEIKQLIVVLAAGDATWQELNIQHPKIITTLGGATRAQSTLNALISLENIAKQDDLILVHDAARPYVPVQDLEALIHIAENEEAGAILAAPVADTLKCVKESHIEATVPRKDLYRALTPQCFKYDLLRQALQQAEKQNIEVTDDAMAIELLGYKPAVVIGDAMNIKITYSQDLDLLAFLLSR